MTSDKFNEYLREIFKSLVSDGFKKSDISSATFGLNKQDQFIKFTFNDRNMGLKPLNPIFNDIGFELHLVPIVKNDYKSKEFVDNITNESFYAFKMMLLDFLERKKESKIRKDNISEFIINKINKIKEES